MTTHENKTNLGIAIYILETLALKTFCSGSSIKPALDKLYDIQRAYNTPLPADKEYIKPVKPFTPDWDTAVDSLIKPKRAYRKRLVGQLNIGASLAHREAADSIAAPQTLGQLVLKTRVERNVSQAALARAVDISSTYIGNIEKDLPTHIPTDRIVEAIAKFLDSDPAVFAEYKQRTYYKPRKFTDGDKFETPGNVENN